MHISKEGLDLIKKYEGFYSKAYVCPGGALTIGYGTTNSDSKILNYTITKNSTITKEKASEFLKKSIEKKYEPLVNKYNNVYKFNQNQFDALTSFCYNIGNIDQLTAKGTKTIVNIARDMILYDHAAGVKLKGLTKRREEEQKLFNTPMSHEEIKDNNVIKYYVNVGSLNVRKGPGTNYSIISFLKKNSKIDISENSGTWGRISNTSNWINLKYCKKCNVVTSNLKKSKLYYINTDYLNVRNGPGVNYKIVNVLARNQKVYIKSNKGNWGNITNSNNWLNLKYCKRC